MRLLGLVGLSMNRAFSLVDILMNGAFSLVRLSVNGVLSLVGVSMNEVLSFGFYGLSFLIGLRVWVNLSLVVLRFVDWLAQ